MRFNQLVPKVMGLVGVSLFVFTAATAKAEDKSLNLSKINQVLATVLSDVLKDNNGELGKFFTAASFKVDEAGTDLSSKEYLKLKISSRATARGAVWSEGDTTLQLDLAAAADLNKKSAEIELKSSLETDTVKLFNFAAGRLAPEYCQPKEPATDLDKQLCKHLTAMSTAVQISVVFHEMVDLIRLHSDYSLGELRKLEAKLAAATKPEEIAYLEKRVKNAKEDLAISYFVRAQFINAMEKGKLTGKYSVKLQDLNFLGTTELREFELYLDDKTLDLGLRLQQTNIKDMANYFKRRDQIEAELLKLQNSDPKSMKDVHSTIQWVLAITKDFIGKP